MKIVRWKKNLRDPKKKIRERRLKMKLVEWKKNLRDQKKKVISRRTRSFAPVAEFKPYRAPGEKKIEQADFKNPAKYLQSCSCHFFFFLFAHIVTNENV
jgi:hypothetical protein